MKTVKVGIMPLGFSRYFINFACGHCAPVHSSSVACLSTWSILGLE